jgi:hypothetical protein
MLLEQVIRRILNANFSFRTEKDPLLFHQIQTTGNYPLLQLEVRDSKREKSTSNFISFKDSNRVTGSVQLLSSG